MKIEYKEGLIVLKDQDEEVGYIKYVKKEENVIDVISTVVHEKYQGQGMAGFGNCSFGFHDKWCHPTGFI